MADFKLELMYKGWSPENNHQKVMERALDFRFTYLQNHPELLENSILRRTFLQRELKGEPNYPDGFKDVNNGADSAKIYSLMQGAERGSFWRVLNLLQASPRQNDFLFYESDESLNARRQEAQQWTDRNLTLEEQQEILTIIVNQALNPPVKGFLPGETQGHSILLEGLVKRPSPYSCIVSDDFRARLVNGAFWEEVSGMRQSHNKGIAFWRVDDILVDYFSDLNPDSASWGFPLYQGKIDQFNISRLSVEGLDNYIEFIDSVHKVGHKNISEQDLDPFVKAYLSSATDKSDRDPFYMRFPLKKKGSFRTRMKHPLVQEYLAKSDDVLNSFTGFLARVAVDEDAFYTSTEVTEMIKNTPNPTKTMQEMVLRMTSDDRDRIPEFYDDSLKPFTSEYTQGMLDANTPIDSWPL